MSYNNGQNNLDKLLKKYENNGMWKHEEDDSSYEDAINAVQKRFNIKRNERVEGTGKPKMKPIPFYSHQSDIFSENADNSALFEDATEKDLEIGILERLKESANCGLEDTRQVGISFLDNAVKIIKTEISPREIIKIVRKKTKTGDLKYELNLTTFNSHCLTSLEQLYRNSKYKSKEIYSDKVVQDTIDGLYKMVLNSLSILNDSITVITNQKIFEIMKSDDETVRIFRKLFYKSEEMSYSRMIELFTEANARIFEFSKIICDNIAPSLSPNILLSNLKIITHTRYVPGLGDEVDNFKKEITRVVYEELFGNNYNGFINNKSMNDDNSFLGDFVDLPKTIGVVPKRNLSGSKPKWI